MTRFIAAASSLSLALVLVSCDEGPPRETFVQPPVGVLDTGEHRVLLHSSPEGPLYTLEKADGQLVARELTREEFSTQFPDLREEISSLWAGNSTGNTVIRPESRPIFEDLLGVTPSGAPQ